MFVPGDETVEPGVYVVERHDRCSDWLGEDVAMSSDAKNDGRALTRFVQDAIDKGATTVEDIHKSIADLPLRILEESDLLKGPAREVRRVQDHTIGAIYDVIREINQQVGTLASTLLAEAAKRRNARA
jgi:histone H3/H4